MSIARAFTTKRAKRDSPDAPQRSLTNKQSFTTASIRNKISSPVELLSTTNMLSYNAPDLHQSSSPSTAYNSASDASDSDHKSISSVSTPPSSPDSDKEIPEPNHLSCYFNAQPASGLSAAKSTPDLKEAAATAAPKIPTRAPSHTKRSHESLLSHKKSASKVSLSHKSSAPAMVLEDKTSSSAIRSSLQMFNSIHQRSVSNGKQSLQSPLPPPPPTPGQQIHSKQPSIGDLQFQGLPTKPNHRMPPMQSRARSHSNLKSPHPPPFPPHPHPQLATSDRPNTAAEAINAHPFGNELAQVNELAEEFSGGKIEFADEESAFMAERGLVKFSADDYMSEIQGLFVRAFGEMRVRAVGVGVGDMWI